MDTSTEGKVLGCIGGVILLPFTMIARGIALSYMWEWFMEIPLGLPHIGTAHAIGISCLYAMVTSRSSDDKEKSDSKAEDLPSKFMALIIMYMIVLGIAWIVSRWM